MTELALEIWSLIWRQVSSASSWAAQEKGCTDKAKRTVDSQFFQGDILSG